MIQIITLKEQKTASTVYLYMTMCVITWPRLGSNAGSWFS